MVQTQLGSQAWKARFEKMSAGVKSVCSQVTLDLCLSVHLYETEQNSDPVQRSDLLVSTLLMCATNCPCLITILLFCLENI